MLVIVEESVLELVSSPHNVLAVAADHELLERDLAPLWLRQHGVVLELVSCISRPRSLTL